MTTLDFRAETAGDAVFIINFDKQGNEARLTLELAAALRLQRALNLALPDTAGTPEQ
jgi:hypothetical protein